MNDTTTVTGRTIGRRHGSTIYEYAPTCRPHAQTNTASGWTLNPSDGEHMTTSSKRILRTIAISAICVAEALRDYRHLH